MPKRKTNKAVKKRFKITKSGKLLSTKSFKRHLMTDKTSKKKRQNRGWKLVDEAEVKKIKAMLPYGRG
jgi:large subunit ribosomal protein L35